MGENFVGVDYPRQGLVEPVGPSANDGGVDCIVMVGAEYWGQPVRNVPGWVVGDRVVGPGIDTPNPGYIEGGDPCVCTAVYSFGVGYGQGEVGRDQANDKPNK